MFDTGDEVKTNEVVPRTGFVRAQLASGEYRVCFDALDTDCDLFAEAQLTLVKEEPPIVTLASTNAPIIVPEDAAAQQAKQQATLSQEELAQLAAEHQAELDRQAAVEARVAALTLESLDARVDALERAAGSTPSISSSIERKGPSFDVGDEVKTDEAVPRTGFVREKTADGRYQVCFDALDTDCALFTAAQLTLVKDEPAIGA